MSVVLWWQPPLWELPLRRHMPSPPFIRYTDALGSFKGLIGDQVVSMLSWSSTHYHVQVSKLLPVTLWSKPSLTRKKLLLLLIPTHSDGS
jgi:hypothetical protein